MTTIGTRVWLSAGAGRSHETRPDNGDERFKLDVKRLAKSQASLLESERMLQRQTVLLAELRADGFATTEAEKSVARLEAALLVKRSAHESLVAEAGADS